MPTSSLTRLEQALDRRWRGGHPFRPRLSRKRRIGMLVLFCFLCAVIGAYWYLTDAVRVRAMAEVYLSRILGGRVDVGQANLSIFEGLRLDDVRVHVDQSSDEESVLFRAKTFKLDYNPRALLLGKIEAAQIVAIGPELRLAQDRATGEWNYQQMIRAARDRKRPTTRKIGPGAPTAFPEILLRDGRVDNGEVVNGIYRPLGTLGFEGRLSPTGDEGRFAFEIQCHGPSDPVGPALLGWVVPDTGQFRLQLRDFAFGRDIRGMLPLEVRDWWQQHALAGTIDATDVYYTPAKGDAPPDWRVETRFKGVTLRIRPDEWRTRRQNRAMQRIASALAWPRSFTLGSPHAAPAKLFKFTSTVPIHLERGEGVLAFDSAGIEIKDLQGYIEGSHIRIAGRYDGYTPDAQIQLHIESVGPEHITVAKEPKFIYSLPVDVFENWQRFQPVGSVKLALDVTRPDGATKPRVKGVIDIIDGYFTCDRFPYTVRKPSGQILLDVDPDNGGGTLELRDLKGYGQLGGPNENKLVTVSGIVTALGPNLGMHIEVAADDIVSEPAILAAIPHEAQSVLTLFDAPGKGEFPRFSGGFKCWIDRAPGKDKHIFVNLDLDIRNGSGRLQSFPYPLENFSARAEIRDDHVDIRDAKMTRNGTELAVAGRVRWKDHLNTGEKIGTDIKVAVKNMKIDDDLLSALTPVRRQWLQKSGLTGSLDFAGRVFSDKSEKDIVVDLGLTLKDGSIYPGPDGAPALSAINGNFHLTGEQIQLQSLTGRRGDGTVTLDGLVSWQNDQPRVALQATANNLALDKPLYDLLPPEAREGWDAVQPTGTVDATLSFSSDFSNPQSPASQLATSNQQLATSSFSLSLRPRTLSITPKVAPYRLDNLSGEITVSPDGQITLSNLKGTHGPGTVTVSGHGSTAAKSDWTLSLSARDLPVDDEFLAGIPNGVRTVLRSVEYKGALGFDLPTFTYRADTGAVDFAGDLLPTSASLTAGVPMTDVKGKVSIAGSVRDERLTAVSGALAIDSMKVAGRDARDLHAELSKPAVSPDLQIRNLQGELAGGAVAGDITVSLPAIPAPTRYAVNLVVRDADVKQISGDPNMNGSFTASVELEGAADDPRSRIGRGDVLATGKDMYQVPVLMGLLQITNLSLPFTSPFNQAQATYILQGNQMTFEHIELRSQSIVMRGNGSINFDDKRVNLTFNTDSPTHWIRLPIVAGVWDRAKKELFQISVRGTVQDPKVSAQAFHTVTTTVDEVLNSTRSK